MPEGREVLSEVFSVTYDKYGDFPIHISICRAESDLEQTGDNRHGGLLLVDDADVVLGISLFKFDNEPLAARFFGEVRIERFRELLQDEETVLREERDGLNTRHPFCEILIREIENRIEARVKEERLRRQKEAQSKIDQEEAARYKKAFSILNEIAVSEIEDVTNLGGKPDEKVEDPPNGFCIYPAFAQITVSKRYAFELRLSTKVVHHGTVIKVATTHPSVRTTTPEIKISSKDGTGILRKYITVQGNEPNVTAVLYATTDNLRTEAKISVVPEKELLLDEGMVFQPETVTLRPNQPRRIYLLVYTKIIEGGSNITISSDNQGIQVSKEVILVNETDAVRHVAKYEIEVWGEGAGQKGVITAESGTHIALLDVRIRSKEEREEEGKKGMFREPDFNYDPDPSLRTQYSKETGQVIIYVNFPSVKHYLGENCEYRKTLPAQVLVADLVAERCFYVIAERKVDTRGVLLRPEGRLDEIQRQAYLLSRKHGKKVHEALVDQSLVKQCQSDAK